MYKTIFIGGINRSGGSLLARLLDGHPDVASYPLENGFPHDYNIYPLFESITGIPITIPSYESIKREEVHKILGVHKVKPDVILKWGKETSDPVGVRKNYLEKVFYGKVETDFDFDKFSTLLDKYIDEAKTTADLFDAKHRAYFTAWDNGKHFLNKKYIVMHDSAGLYLTNIDKYFEEFKGSFFIYPLRDVMGYIASEKTRLARRFYGSRRFSYPKFPNILVKTFKNYDLDAQIRSWNVAVTRVVLLQKKFGVSDRFVVYGNENLLNYTEETMKKVAEKVEIDYHPTLIKPTIAGQPWKGNSHQGKQEGINKELAEYYPKVLTSDEIAAINKATGPIRNFISQQKGTPLDLTGLNKDVLYDYNYQKKYFDDKEKIALYYALVNSPRRRALIKAQGLASVAAYLYGNMVRIIHVPRMLKLRFFKEMGKQNYT